ncbi:MAG: DUF1549 and DUF1553 domain-containing protein [Gemmataceae bacterium]|nr:DUF1549 and DUF1553 domain-containing protein [Gemmataceae bacterium]
MVRSLLLTPLVFASLTASAWADDKLLPPDRPIAEVVDHYLDARLKKAKVNPAPAATDSALLRRLTLDLNGRIPTPAEMAEYTSSADPERKVKLVDQLMASPAFVRHQASEFAASLQSGGVGNRKGPKGGLREYLQMAFGENRPWDQIFRELMLPDDNDPKKRGASEYLRSRVKDLDRLTIDVSSTFFGVNVSCAQCHDHPHVNDWKQDHFYGMKSFFVRTFESGQYLGERDFGAVKFIPNKGKEKLAQVMFLTGKVIDAPGLKEVPKGARKPGGGKGGAPPPPPQFSLRAKLVELALEPGESDFFARAIVNRVWHRLFGRGLVMPLDQMHSANPPTHPDLLAWLARDLAEHKYDLSRLVRGLVLSNAYARGSRWEGGDAPDERLFAVAQVRPLSPQPLATALRLAVADPKTLPGAGPELEQKVESVEKAAGNLARLFPQPGDNFQVGASEAMLFANNEGLLKELLADAPGSLVARLKQVADLEQRADLAVRSVLSRPARAEEARALADYMRQRSERSVEASQQVVWALLTSAEFRFNH